MSSKLKEIITADVQALIKRITGFEEDHENFKTCERFIMSNLLHHRYVSLNKHTVRRSIEGIVLKFHVNGLLDSAQELDSLVKKFLECCDFDDYATVDIKWCLLSLLLNLAQNPTSAIQSTKCAIPSPVANKTGEGKEFDWVEYLREGDEDFQRHWSDDTSDEDEVDCMAVMENEPKFHLPSSTLKDITTPLSSSLNSLTYEDTLSVKQTTSQKSPYLNAQSILHAESWLRDHVQHNWWAKAYTQHKTSSSNPFAQSALLMDPARKEGIKTSTLSEHKIVLEVIWLLSAPCDTAVFMRGISDDGLKTHYTVRPHITIPSLIQDVFSSFMKSVCTYANMIENLQFFCSELLINNELEKVSGTYEAYRFAIHCELQLFFEALASLEQRAHNQESTFTLLMLSKELSPWFSLVASLYKLHTSAVLDWKVTPNWICATHLLSVILSSLQSSEKHICKNFRIFVRTFEVYVNKIDQWLSCGQLNDPRDEFFIIRRKKQVGFQEASFEKRDWEREVKARGVEPPRALQVLANSLLKAAQPLHILFELNRLPELRKHISTRSSFETLFLQNLISDLKTSQLTVATEESSKVDIDAWWKQLDYHMINKDKPYQKFTTADETPQSIKAVDVEAIMGHLHRLEEPLLFNYFQTIFCEFNAKVTGVDKNKAETSLIEKVLLLSNSSSVYLPLESCIERAVLQISVNWEETAGALVADLLIREHQLFFHMHIAQSVFMLQSSHKLNPFISHLFKLILHERDSLLTDSHSLSVLLQDCMDSDQLSVFVCMDKSTSAPTLALDCIDLLSFNYQVEWPLCFILGEKIQQAYNVILRLLLKLRWGLWLLEKLNVSDFKNQKSSDIPNRLLHLRFWLLHVLRGSYSFLAGHILNALWVKFEDDVKSAKDMHSIIQVHGKFLDSVLKKSLHAKNPDPIKNALFQLVVLAENLHTLWSEGLRKVSVSKLSNMEMCYSECHLFLAASLHTLAEKEGLQDLVFLSDLFNWNIPWKS